MTDVHYNNNDDDTQNEVILPFDVIFKVATMISLENYHNSNSSNIYINNFCYDLKFHITIVKRFEQINSISHKPLTI